MWHNFNINLSLQDNLFLRYDISDVYNYAFFIQKLILT